jgi:two-component system NtrC family sensor kinase
VSASHRHIAAESRRALYPRLVVAAIIHSGVAWTQWGAWSRVGALWAGYAAYVAASIMLTRWNRETRALLVAKFGLNVGLVLLSGHFSSWSLPAWLYLVFFALARDSASYRVLRWNYFGLMVVACVVALVEHGDPFALVFCVLIALATYASAERRLRFTAKILDELAQRNAALTRANAEIEAMHARAVEQEKLSGLGMLAAGIAHEINNPMTFVTSNLELLLEDLLARDDLDATLAEYANDIVPETLEGVRRVNSIVQDLRRFSRRDPESMSEYDLNEQVETALRIMQSKIKHRCELELDLAPLPHAMGLPGQLVQVVINLLDNAVDAQPTGRGFIRVSTSAHGDAIVLRIADRGIGMTPEVRGKMFEPFFTTKAVGEGTGLGLSVTYGIVKAHAGTIEIESTLGEGSAFVVRLPVQPGLAKLQSVESRERSEKIDVHHSRYVSA